MLNSIKTLKRYCKATLNMFFNKKIVMMTKNVYSYDGIFESNQNFTIEHVKIVKIPGFFSDFCSKFKVFPVFFCPNCQIPGFSRTPGKVATLYI